MELLCPLVKEGKSNLYLLSKEGKSNLYLLARKFCQGRSTALH